MVYYQKSKEEKGELVHSIEVCKIYANPNQPRKVFSDEAIIKLADSIRQYGIIQPLTVRKFDEKYELISGERRLRAAKELGMDRVPCIIMDINEEKSAEISIIENLIREDLNIFEQAQAIEALIDTYNLTQEEIARKLCNSQSFVANKLRLLRLTTEEKEKILKNNLTERHARALLRIYNTDTRGRILNEIIENGLNVGKTEELIEKALGKDKNRIAEKRGSSSKDVRSLCSIIDKAIDNVKSSGVNIKSRRVENDEFVELTILIPKKTSDNSDATA